METNILICLTIIIAACCTQCVGICIPPCTGNFVCSGSLCDTCNTGFYGNDCTDTCEDSGAASCQNGGTCGASSPRSCSCTSGFTGTLCDTESNVVPPVRKHPCNWNVRQQLHLLLRPLLLLLLVLLHLPLFPRRVLQLHKIIPHPLPPVY